MLKKFFVTAATTAALACTSLTVTAGYTSLTVFGDSLSDGGNDYIFTGNQFPPPPYAQRFSNGPTAVERLASNLGLPLQPSLAGGSNYAFGGAETGLDNFERFDIPVPFAGPTATGALAQVQSFAGAFGPNSLVVLWAGPNDLFTALTLGQNPANIIAPAMNNLAQSVGLLYGAGAREILMPNMPDIGATPFGLTSGNAAGLTAFSVGFDFFLNQTINQLELGLSGLDIIRFDTFSAIHSLIANAGAYGFTDVTHPCFDELAQTVCANPNQYIFWDDVHPTARTHQLLGDGFTTAVPEPTTLAMLGLGLASLGFARRRKLS